MKIADADAAFSRIVGDWCGFNLKRLKFNKHRTLWNAKSNKIYCEHCNKQVNPQQIIEEYEAFSGTDSQTDSSS